MSTEKKWSEVWVNSSFETNLNQSIEQKSKKRSINETINSEPNEESNCDSTNNNSNINPINNSKMCLIDAFVPNNSHELAFSKHKFNQLNDWFRKQFIDNQNESKFLLLNGPTGSGKTTSVKVLAKEYNVEVLEYKAHNQYLETDCFDSTLNQMNKNTVMSVNQFESFKSFVWDSNYLNKSLVFESSDGVISSSKGNQSADRSKRLIIIEEFPNVFYYKPENLHKELHRLQTRFGSRCVPIVFIISETINGHSDEYKLLPNSVQTELRIQTITFKPISNLSLNKLLSKLCDNQLSKNEIQSIIDGSSGDVRSAINNMQLKYMHSFNDKPKNKTGIQKTKKIKSCIDSDFDSGGRDASLSLSHAIGKVLYCKRLDSETDTTNKYQENSFKMPEHLSHNERKPLIENAENIAEKVVVSSDVFNGWLHENYLDFVDDIDKAEQCIHWLSESDYMFSGQDITNKPICDSYQLSLAMRGLMFNLSTANSRSSDSKLSDSKVGSNETKFNFQKSKRKFKAFAKPQTFAVNRAVNLLKHQTRQSVPQLTPFSGRDSLVIDLIPFISQMPSRLHETDSRFRSVLNKVVNYDESVNTNTTETELCDALSQSSFNHNFGETKISNCFTPINCIKNVPTFANTTQEAVNNNSFDSDLESDYVIENDSE